MDNTHLNETSTNESAPVNQALNETTENASETVNESEKLHAEMAVLQDKYVRLAADFENFKRNARRDRDELRQTAGKEIIVSLLDVLDDCDRAEKQVQGMDHEMQKNFEGTLLVFNKLRRILEQKGVKPLESMDTEFDVEKHEAITQMDVPDAQKGKVIDELMKGYYLNEKLIRFAKVVVGK
jgi:molecular chaperone GrpE